MLSRISLLLKLDVTLTWQVNTLLVGRKPTEHRRNLDQQDKQSKEETKHSVDNEEQRGRIGFSTQEMLAGLFAVSSAYQSPSR